MVLLSEILTLDRTLTLAINGWHSPFADQFFFVFTHTGVWIPLFVVFALLLWHSCGWRTALSVVIAAALAVLFSDQICNIFKYTVCRLRPTHEPSLEGLVHTVNGYVGGDYGFCSSHAANTVALALFTSLVVRRWAYSLSISSWVLLSCWSRIHLGVHYLGDILVGLLVGSLVSLLLYVGWRKSRWGKEPCNVSVSCPNALIYCYFATIVVVLILAYSMVR